MVSGISFGMAMAVLLFIELPADDPLQRVIDMRRKISALDLEVQLEYRHVGRHPETKITRWTCYDNRLRNDVPTKAIWADGSVHDAKSVMCFGCYEEQGRLFHVSVTRSVADGPTINAGHAEDPEAVDMERRDFLKGLDLRRLALSSLQTSFSSALEYKDLEALIPSVSPEKTSDSNITIRDYRHSAGSVCRYWFDASQGNQIVRFMLIRPDNIASGLPAVEQQMENQQLESTGVWFPRKVHFKMFSDDAERKIMSEEIAEFRILSIDREECELRTELGGIEILKPGDKLLVISKDGAVRKTWDGEDLVSPPAVKATAKPR